MEQQRTRPRPSKVQLNSRAEIMGLGDVSEALKRTLSDLAELGSRGGNRWLFPRGIDSVYLSVDIKSGKFEVKLSGAPQGLEVSGLDGLKSLTADSVATALRFAIEMEHLPPPPPPLDPDAPTPGDASKLKSKTLVEAQLELVQAPLESVAASYRDSCAGGDSLDNNCAHFLSDAFIRAGYTELNPPASCINARCDTNAKRPVRARDMWCWFKSKATKTSTTLTKDTGWWAAFQLDESVYWGGHVVLVDSSNWHYYGTGWYPDWDQYLYQW